MYCTYCILAKPTVLNVKSAVGWIREYFIENDYYARVRTFSRFLCRLRLLNIVVCIIYEN